MKQLFIVAAAALLLGGYLNVRRNSREGLPCMCAWASLTGGWEGMETAPRDGRVIQIMNAYGLWPGISFEQWANQSLNGVRPYKVWVNTENPAAFYPAESERCLYWRVR